MDFGKILGNTFTLWYKDRETLKLLLMYFAASLVFTLLIVGAAYLFFASAVDIYTGAIASSNPAIGTQGVDPETAGTILASFLSNIVPFMLVLVPLVLLYTFALWYLQALLYR